MIEVGAIGHTRLDGPTSLPRLEGQGPEGGPEKGSDEGEGC